MTTQTFANPTFGSTLRRLAALPLVIVSAVAESISWLNPQKARDELMRMAEARAASDPEQAARLRRVATSNWYGEA
jgi:hypothetical protein